MSIDGNQFKVLVNSEGQYSIWPLAKSLPDGWNEVGFIGDKSACSSYINEHWLDMRPASLIQKN